MKRIVDIPDDVVKAIQNGEDYRYDIHTAIAQSIPYNPSGDCISREALKEHKVYSEERHEYVVPVYNIDNAQAIPLPNEQIAWEQGYEAGLAQGKQDRPHGEWLKSGKGRTTFFCSECGREIDTKPFTRPDKFPFCHCGADMRGGAE